MRFSHRMLTAMEAARDGAADDTGAASAAAAPAAAAAAAVIADDEGGEVDEAGTGRTATPFRVAGEGRGGGARGFTLTPIAARKVCFARFDHYALDRMGFGALFHASEGLLDRVFDRSLRSLPRGACIDTDGVNLLVHYEAPEDFAARGERGAPTKVPAAHHVPAGVKKSSRSPKKKAQRKKKRKADDDDDDDDDNDSDDGAGGRGARADDSAAAAPAQPIVSGGGRGARTTTARGAHGSLHAHALLCAGLLQRLRRSDDERSRP